jgi:hypothetical protein
MNRKTAIQKIVPVRTEFLNCPCWEAKSEISAPCSDALTASILSPCTSTIRLTMDRLMPANHLFVRIITSAKSLKNLWQIRCSDAAAAVDQ